MPNKFIEYFFDMHQFDISQATSSPQSLFQTALDGDEVVITQDNEPPSENSSSKQAKKAAPKWKR